jgi:hypothetical protein
MIQVEQHGSVTVIRMARAVLGRPLYWTAAYWLDGLLIDAGPRCTADELVRVLDKFPSSRSLSPTATRIISAGWRRCGSASRMHASTPHARRCH